MIRNCIIYLLLFYSISVKAQTDSSANKNVFGRIQAELAAFKPDTSAVPNDRITRKIIELRAVRGGFNINEVMQFKIQEALQDEHTAPAARKMQYEFTQGNARHWLDNAVIHLYRDAFTYKELKTLVKFYKTSTGQKFGDAFPLIIVKTLAAAEKMQEWMK